MYSRCQYLQIHRLWCISSIWRVYSPPVAISCIYLHQLNVYQSLGACSNVWGDMECKLRTITFRRVSHSRREFWPACKVTWMSDDWYMSTLGVIVLCFEACQCTRENFRYTWECRQCLGSSSDSGNDTYNQYAASTRLVHQDQDCITPIREHNCVCLSSDLLWDYTWAACPLIRAAHTGPSWFT